MRFSPFTSHISGAPKTIFVLRHFVACLLSNKREEFSYRRSEKAIKEKIIKEKTTTLSMVPWENAHKLISLGTL